MAEVVAERPVRLLSIARHPIGAMLFPVPVVCFIGALLADLAYECSGGNLLWVDFSGWLILAGLIVGALAALVLLIDFIRDRVLRRDVGWAHLLLFYAALLVELFSMFIHSRDGWTAVVPGGLALSIVGVVLILIAGWLRRLALEVLP